MTANIAKVALVIDAASHLGRAVALALAERGWDIAVHYQQDDNGAAETVDAVEALGRRSAAVRCDLSSEAEVRTLISRALEELEAVAFSCLINIPLLKANPDSTFSFAAMGRHMQANLAAPIALAQALYDATPPEAQAVVINLFDCHVFKPDGRFLHEMLSASALNTATIMLAQSLAPRLRVAGVAANLLPLQGQPPHAENGDTISVPGQLASNDIAATVCFAVESTALTGTTILINGRDTLTRSEPAP